MILARAFASSDALNHMLWAGWLAGPVAWFVQVEVVYALASGYCGPKGRLGLHLVSLCCLALAAVGAWVAWQAWVLIGHAESSPSEGATTGRARFMAALGFLGCLLSVVIILAQWIAVWLLDPCPL